MRFFFEQYISHLVGFSDKHCLPVDEWYQNTGCLWTPIYTPSYWKTAFWKFVNKVRSAKFLNRLSRWRDMTNDLTWVKSSYIKKKKKALYNTNHLTPLNLPPFSPPTSLPPFTKKNRHQQMSSYSHIVFQTETYHKNSSLLFRLSILIFHHCQKYCNTDWYSKNNINWEERRETEIHTLRI